MALVFLVGGLATSAAAAPPGETKIVASDGAASDWFGFSVAVSGNTMVVGAPDDDVRTGSAYVFTGSGDGWSEAAKLAASDGDTNDIFGNSVAVSGATIVIGARFDDDNGSNSGSVYVFTRSGDGWSEAAKLTASDGDVDDSFGFSVAISGSTIVVGAPRDDGFVGSAYVYPPKSWK